MIAALSAAWTWFVGTKVGRWLVGMTLALAGLAAALFVAFLKGKHAQARTDEAKAAQASKEAAQTAATVQADAAQAAQKVQADAAKQPPPDTVKRNDLDNTF